MNVEIFARFRLFVCMDLFVWICLFGVVYLERSKCRGLGIVSRDRRKYVRVGSRFAVQANHVARYNTPNLGLKHSALMF